MLKSLILALQQAGLTETVYYGFHVAGFVAVVLFNMWFGGKYGISKRDTVLIALIVYPLTYAWMLVQYWIESGFQNFGGQNIVRSFIYIPLFCMVAARVMKYERKLVWDFVSASPCVVQCVSHLGCVFAGCCRGYPAAHGIYNPVLDTTVFPSPPLESLVALGIVLVLVYRAKKRDWQVDGKNFPIMLALFGSTRFLLEFLRDNEKVLWGCSTLSFHALLMCAVGLAWLAAMRYMKTRGKAKENV